MYKKLTPRARTVSQAADRLLRSLPRRRKAADIMTAAWNTPYDSDRVLVVLDRGHTTTKNIVETGNSWSRFRMEGQIADINRVGSIHGRDSVTSSPGRRSLRLLKSSGSRSPDALVYIECEPSILRHLQKTGVCIGKAVNITVKEELDEEHSSFAAGFAKTCCTMTSEDAYYTNARSSAWKRTSEYDERLSAVHAYCKRPGREHVFRPFMTDPADPAGRDPGGRYA